MRNSTILLVDDDPLILKTLGPDLENHGYDVSTADSGDGALDILSDCFFDLIITDLVMDEVDGIDVLKKAKERDPDTMVIVLTGHGDMDSAIEALRHNADDYMLKPCDSEELHHRVQRCFDNLELSRKVKFYESILPVCAVCKKIRDDARVEPGTGKWFAMEEYLHRKGGVNITSGLCPECFEEASKELL